MMITLSRLRNAPRRDPVTTCLFVALLACAACGSAATSGASDSGLVTRTSQGPLTQDAWAALLKDDSALSALATAQKSPWLTAGQIVGTDGTTFVWAEFAADASAARQDIATVWRSCPKAEGETKPTCTAGTAAYTATGAKFTDATNKELATLPIAAPQAWEWETSTNLDKDNSTIVAGLSGDAAPLDPLGMLAQFNAILPQKRRFVVLSSYGPQLGVDVSPIVHAAQQTGRFDSVETLEFVRRSDLETLLPSLTALDVVVWVGAGVQQKPSKTSPPTKAVGMNVTRGVVGDETYYGKIAGPLLDAPPLGGPGLVVLAGQNTFLGDVNDKASLAAVWYEPGTRPIVGFSLPLGLQGPEGFPRIALRDVIASTATLVSTLGEGKSLEDAIVAGSAGRDFTLTSTMASDNRKKWTWSASNASFWDKQPSTGKLLLKMNLTKFGQCVEQLDTCDVDSWKAGKQASVVNGKIALECANPVFVGPYFSCTGGNTQPPGTKFTVTGVMRGRAADDHLLFIVAGEQGGPLGGAVIIGDGQLTKDGTDIGGGTTTYSFDGMAAFSPFTDASGNCCIIHPAVLTGDDASDLSTLQLHN